MIELILLGVLLIIVFLLIWMPPAPDGISLDRSQAERSRAAARDSRITRRVMGSAAAVLVVVAAVALAVRLSSSPDDGPVAPLLVVLPFESIGDQDPYMADGFTDEVTTRLASVSGLRVGSRALIRRVTEAGESFTDLGVDYLLEGSVSLEGPGDDRHLRVRARLVDGRSLTQVWAEVFDEPVDLIFQVGGQIAQSVAAAMDVTVLGVERSVIARPRTENFAAYQAFLEGVTYRRRIREREGGLAALESFRRAAELDPSFAAAWAAQAGTHAWLSHLHGFGQHSDSARAKVAFAESLDSTDLDVRMARAMVAWSQDRDLTRADAIYAELDRVIDPLRRPIVRMNWAAVHARLGRWEEATDKARQAVSDDPVLAQGNLRLAELLLYQRAYDEVVPLLARASASVVRDSRRTRYGALLPLLSGGDVDTSARLLDGTEAVERGEAIGSGLFADGRILARVHSDRETDHEQMEAFREAAPAVQAGAALARAVATREREGQADFEPVVELLEQVLEDSTVSPYYEVLLQCGLAVALAGAGDHARARDVIGGLRSSTGQGDDELLQLEVLFASAETRAMEGDLAAAARELRELLDRPSLLSGELISVDPLFSPLLDDPELRVAFGESEPT